MILKKPLHELDRVIMSNQLKEKTLQGVMTRKRKHRNSVFAIVSLATCVMFALLLHNTLEKQTSIYPSAAPYAYVSFDINPSLEFYLDEQNQILDVISYNKDSDAILQALDVEGYEVTEAIQMLLNNSVVQAYMENGFLQLSVYSDDSSRSVELEQQLNSALSTMLNQDKYTCYCASRKEQQEAKAHHMSFGRYQIIDAIIQSNATYTIEQLQNYSMRELHELYAQVTNSDSYGHHSETNKEHHAMHK